MPDSITLYVHGATDEEIARGEAAARAVFQGAGREPFGAASAYAAIEYADEMGQLDDDGAVFDDAGIKAWSDAFPAALDACCAGWTTEPLYTNFIVRPEGEPLPPQNQAVTAEVDRLMAMPDAELSALWSTQPDTADMLNSLIYWAADQRRLNYFPIGGAGAAVYAGAAPSA